MITAYFLLTRFQMAHTLTTPQDNARGFMADNTVTLKHQRSNATRLPEMYIRPADTGRLDVYQHLSLPRRIDRCLDWL